MAIIPSVQDSEREETPWETPASHPERVQAGAPDFR